MDERFSATLDNEASRNDVDAAISAALAEPDARACWTRQYWMRAALQATPGEPQPRLDANFADRVMAALPVDSRVKVSGAESGADEAANVANLSSRRRSRTHRTAWRNGFGVAAAASIVGVVIFAYAPYGTYDTASGVDDHSDNTIAAQSMAAGMMQTVASRESPRSMASVEARGEQNKPDTKWSVSSPALRRELNSYLVEHHSLARTFGFSASTESLVQAVAYRNQTSR